MREYNGLSLCRYFPAEGNSGLQMLNFVYEPKPFDCKEPEYSDRYYFIWLPKAKECFAAAANVTDSTKVIFSLFFRESGIFSRAKDGKSPIFRTEAWV